MSKEEYYNKNIDFKFVCENKETYKYLKRKLRISRIKEFTTGLARLLVYIIVHFVLGGLLFYTLGTIILGIVGGSFL